MRQFTNYILLFRRFDNTYFLTPFSLTLFPDGGPHIRRRRWAIIFLTAFCTSGAVARASGEDGDLLGALAAIENSHHALCSSTEGTADLKSSIGLLISEMQSTPGESATPLREVFSRLGIRGSPDLKDPCNLLLSRVLQRKQGYCVGIAALYLAVAERLQLPIYAVATPSHVFLRYDDGTTHINIEALQGGANLSDEQYIREQKIPEKSIRRGVFMRNLTTDEFLAQVYSNLGVIYSERKKYVQAALQYERALDLDSKVPAALYNYGNDLLKTGSYRHAVHLFSKSLRLYPTDVWALNNRGLAYVKLGKREKARQDFEAALKIDPTFEQARRNLDGIQ